MHSQHPLPPELDPAAPDPTLEPSHATGEPSGRHPDEDRSDGDIEPGAS